MAHQDANQAWPAFVAKAFDADFHNISWSGAGVVWNAGAGCSADAPFHDLYSRNLGSQTLCKDLRDFGMLYLFCVFELFSTCHPNYDLFGEMGSMFFFKTMKTISNYACLK